MDKTHSKVGSNPNKNHIPAPPKEEKTKRYTVQAVVAEAEKAYLEECAKKAGMPVSEYVRRCAFKVSAQAEREGNFFTLLRA